MTVIAVMPPPTDTLNYSTDVTPTVVRYKSDGEKNRSPTKALDTITLTRWMGRINDIVKNRDMSIPHAARVLEFLYLGGYQAAKDLSFIESNGITHVLNCAPDRCMNLNSSFYLPSIVKVRTINAADTFDFPILDHLDTVLEFIESARNSNGRVLVHCFAGHNRSPALTVAYLMAALNWDLITSVNHVHQSRPMILSNTGFQKLLVEYAHSHNLLSQQVVSSDVETTKPSNPLAVVKSSPVKHRVIQQSSEISVVRTPIDDPLSPLLRKYLDDPNDRVLDRSDIQISKRGIPTPVITRSVDPSSPSYLINHTSNMSPSEHARQLIIHEDLMTSERIPVGAWTATNAHHRPNYNTNTRQSSNSVSHHPSHSMGSVRRGMDGSTVYAQRRSMTPHPGDAYNSASWARSVTPNPEDNMYSKRPETVARINSWNPPPRRHTNSADAHVDPNDTHVNTLSNRGRSQTHTPNTTTSRPTTQHNNTVKRPQPPQPLQPTSTNHSTHHHTNNNSHSSSNRNTTTHSATSTATDSSRRQSQPESTNKPNRKPSLRTNQNSADPVKQEAPLNNTTPRRPSHNALVSNSSKTITNTQKTSTNTNRVGQVQSIANDTEKRVVEKMFSGHMQSRRGIRN